MKSLRTLPLLAALALAFSAHAAPDTAARPDGNRPAAVELSWTPLKLPNGDGIALAGFNYFVAVDDKWGFGPSVYGAAKGNYGGIFTTGFTAQRRWRLGEHVHAAASLFVGAGGGLSSDQVRFGGGLMVRPELSLRAEFGGGSYAGLGWSQVRFPSGNIRDNRLGLVVGQATDFASFRPADANSPGRSKGARLGVGFDEVVLFGIAMKPSAKTRKRSGAAATARMGGAGAAARQYFVEGSWWGLEAAGAAQGGSDGYMELLVNAGQDWEIGRGTGLRAGAQAAVGLGGGGDVDTGNGWLWRLGPTLRWTSSSGFGLHLDAGFSGAPSGQFNTRFVRLGLAVPLDSRPDSGPLAGIVREQQLAASYQRLSKVRFKDGSTDAIGQIGLAMTRDLTRHLYGVAYAGSAATGKAGAYAFGLFGAGLQSASLMANDRLRVGAEALVGAAGGGGVDVGGGAIAQAEAWAQWRGDRLRLRAGVGQWKPLRGTGVSSPMVNLTIGYAYGTLSP